MDSFFESTGDIVQMVRDTPPDPRNVSPEECDELHFQGRRVGWVGNGYIVEVETDRVLFMQDNIWNFGHAAGVMEAMAKGYCFEIPAARIHRITAADVHMTQDWAKRGELSYQLGMTRPWTRADIGQYEAQLVDGNHRAAAAMALGERSLWVYVGENYRDEVRKKDWTRPSHRR